MKINENFKKLSFIIPLFVVIAAALLFVFLAIQNINQNPFSKTIAAVKNMLSSGDAYCITTEIGGDITSQTLIKGNIKEKELYVQTENLNSTDIVYPFTLVINDNDILLNNTQNKFCDVRIGFSSIISKTYSNKAVIDLRDNSLYLASTPTEEQSAALSNFSNVVFAFLNEKEMSTECLEMLYNAGLIRLNGNDKSLVFDTFKGCFDDFAAWFTNVSVLEDKLEYVREDVPGGFKFSLHISRDIAKELLEILKPLTPYIVVDDPYLLSDEILDTFISELDLSITVSDKKIKEIAFFAEDYTYDVKMTITDCEDFDIDTSKFYESIDIDNFNKGDVITGVYKKFEDNLFSNAKTVYDTDDISLKFLTLYKAETCDDIYALFLFDNKSEKEINLYINNPELENGYLDAGIYEFSYSDKTSDYISLRVGNTEYDANNILINYDISYSFIDSEELITETISFSGIEEGKIYYE